MVLRQLESSDAEFILELLNEPSFLQFVGDKEVRNLTDARAYISKGPMDSYARHGFGLYAALKFERTIRLAAQSPELKLFGSVDPGEGS